MRNAILAIMAAMAITGCPPAEEPPPPPDPMDYSLIGLWEYTYFDGSDFRNPVITISDLVINADGTAARDVSENGIQTIYQEGTWYTDRFASPKQIDFVWTLAIVDGEIFTNVVHEKALYLQSGRLLQISYGPDITTRPPNLVAAVSTFNYYKLLSKVDEIDLMGIFEALLGFRVNPY